MAEPIMASYVQEDGDWTVTVSGLGRELTDRAPGIIAARDRADQLVEKLGPSASGATVVHLLNGSALEFTSVYMTARLTRPESAHRPKTKLTADIGNALSTSRGPGMAAAAKAVASGS